MRDAVVVQDLGKRFRRYRADRPSTIHETLLRGFWKLAPTEYFWGLKDVNFRIAPGRMVAVVGRNGAGKSTLLRLIGGVGRPDKGSIQVCGRVRGLLTLGAGFHPELTGRENLFVNAIIGGLTHREVEARLETIVAFSELEEYIDSPLRVYSSGMQMRLAFSIAIHSDPDILMIDEVLAVGDLAFQRKCLDRIEQVKTSGCTIIVVSHDAGMARELCDEALWLRAGRLEAQGPCSGVIDKYLADAGTISWSHLPVANTTPAAVPEQHPKEELRDELHKFEITGVRVLGVDDSANRKIDSGSPLSIEISFVARRLIEVLNFSVAIRRPDGVSCCDMSTQGSPSTPYGVHGEGSILLHIERLDLGGGLYDIEVCAYGEELSPRFGFWQSASSIAVRSDGSNSGLWRVPHHWETRQPVEAPRASSVAGVVSR
jgi:lipopolysaccharide transport system ATP-binding protein